MPDNPEDTVVIDDGKEVFPENQILDRLFDKNETLEPVTEKKTAPVKKPVTEKPVATAASVDPDDDDKDTADVEDDDLSLDDVVSPDDVVKSEDELDLESDPADETMARKQAKERGREAKRLKMELEQARLKLKETEDQAKQLQTRISEVESSVTDPRSHPDYRMLVSEIQRDVATSAEVLDIADPSVVSQSFGELMRGYISLEDLSGAERSAKLLELRGMIVDRIVKPDVPYEDMTPEERSTHAPIVAEVLRIIQRNRPQISKLHVLEQTLADQAKKGILSRGSKAYEVAVNELRPIVDAVGTLTDELIEADPHSPSALVSRLAKNPDNKSKLEKAKREVIEVLVGAPALTPEQVKSMEAAGTNVKEFLVERDRRIAERRKALAPLLVEAIITRSITKRALKAMLDKNDTGKSSATEVAALRNVGKRGAPPKSEKEKGDLMERLFDESEELR